MQRGAEAATAAPAGVGGLGRGGVEALARDPVATLPRDHVATTLRAAPMAARMARLFAASGRPFGMERSARLRSRRLEARRVLLSQSRDAFPAPAWAALAEAVEALGLAATEWADAALDAQFLHLGHEGDAPETCKLYLERPLPRPAPEGAVVHAAWKWRPGATPLGTTPLGTTPRREFYRFLPPPAAALRLAEMATQPGALGVIATALTAWLPPGAQPFGLDVRDAGTGARASLDLRLYDMDATIAALAPVLDAAAAALDVPAPALAALLDERGTEALGHVALGHGADGEAFLTVYGGAVGVAPAQVP